MALLNWQRFYGSSIEELDLAHLQEDVPQWQKIIMETDIAKSFQSRIQKVRKSLSPALLEMIERGNKYRPSDYNDAVDHIVH